MKSLSPSVRKKHAKSWAVVALAIAIGGGTAAGSHSVATAAASASSQPVHAKGEHAAGLVKHGRVTGAHWNAGGKRLESSEQLADALGISADALKEGRKAGKSLAAIAEEQGITRDTAKAKLVAWLEAHKPSESNDAASGAANGSSTSAKPDKPSWDAGAIADQLLDAATPKPEDGGKGPFSEKAFRFKPQFNTSAIADALGITSDELTADLKAGKSVAAIAGSKGIAADSVVQALTAEVTAQLDKQLSSGKITQSEYDKHAAQLEKLASAIVNGTKPAAGGHRFTKHQPHAGSPGSNEKQAGEASLA
ncbi:hypothetical protein [Paenibacillus protaetiae]|uniref:LysM domain-containing protein n=1 Tax=Paenibacillus protaetiae TaxID=2509456 RepID=A0A4P6F1L1_9BACL|nr:hypothetical protein [Paenibacillus protaetiae]QAY68009.1 hypothetical protein ET464_18160 [Paenibacillus protaetiae]